MIYNILRPGALGDIVLGSSVTSQLNGKVIYYTKCSELAQMCEGVDLAIDSDLWDLRQKGTDIVLSFYPTHEGYPDTPPKRHILEYCCELANVPLSKPKVKSYPRILEGDYITLQRRAGWSQYKEYSHWDEVIKELSLPVIELTEDRPLADSFSLVQHAKLHLGIDSLFNHVAAAYGTRAVILWGSTLPSFSGYDTATNLQFEMDCNPCFKERKDWSVHYRGECLDPCINKIAPDAVVSAATLTWLDM